MTRFRDKLNDYPNLQLVCFSMDPEHDTPEVLSRYAKQQNAEHERWFFLSGKRDEIVRVISRHMHIEQDKVSVKMERGEKVSTLAVDVEIPFNAAKAAVPKKKAA